VPLDPPATPRTVISIDFTLMPFSIIFRARRVLRQAYFVSGSNSR
jgi:hypothetical protein